MKLAVLASLALVMGVAAMGCSGGEVTAEQQQSKQAALQKIADQDKTHVRIPGRDR